MGYLNEFSLLPNLTATFYHGSTKLFDKVEPTAFVPTGFLRKPDWGVFMFRQFDLALNYILSNAIKKHYSSYFYIKSENDILNPIIWRERIGISEYVTKGIIIKEIYDKIYKDIKKDNIEIYVYKLKVPLDRNLDFIGTNPNLPEYIYHGNVETVKIHKIKVTQELFARLFTPVSLSKYKQMRKLNSKYLYGEPIISLFYDNEKRTKEKLMVNYKIIKGKLNPGDNLDFLDTPNSQIFSNILFIAHSLFHQYDWGYKINGKNVTDSDNFKHYKTISPEKFEKDKCGVCWDYVEYEARKLEELGLKPTTDALKNNEYSLYYMQHHSVDGVEPTHTWIAFKLDNQLHVMETAWKSLGKKKMIQDFKNEKEMIDCYIKNQEDYYEKNQGKNYLKEVIILRYNKHKKFGLTPDEYMEGIHKNGKIVYNEWRDK